MAGSRHLSNTGGRGRRFADSRHFTRLKLRARNLVTLGAVLHRLNALVRDRWREQAGDDEEGRGNEVARMDESVEEAEDEASEPLAPVGLGGARARAAAAAHRRTEADEQCEDAAEQGRHDAHAS